MDAAAAELRADGVAFLSEPAVPEGGRTAARQAFVSAPDNVRVAVVEEGFAGVDVAFDAPVDITTELREYTVPRTPWGVPDFQGVWTGDAAHGIPLERPEDLTETEVLTAEQAAARRERGNPRQHLGLRVGVARHHPRLRAVGAVAAGGDGHRPARRPHSARTPEGERLLAAARAARRPIAAGPEDLSSWVRCITRSLVPTPGVYNNGMQIVQGPNHVALQREMIHETRVVPTDDSPHVGDDITSWLGDARGRWEGDTLVVEIRNFNGKAPYQGSSDALTMTERYTRTGPDTLEYQFTIDDPVVWTRPWTGMFTFVTGRDAVRARRVRVPRGQLRDDQHPERRACARRGGVGRRAVARERSHDRMRPMERHSDSPVGHFRSEVGRCERT